MIVVVTGANGFVGAHVCAALSRREATVRAVVRRPGTAPELPGVTEVVADVAEPESAAGAVDGAAAVVTTVHPMGDDLATQRRIGVEGTLGLARTAARAGVDRFLHLSTAAVYDRSPGVGDVDESSALVGEDANAYATTKRDADLALAALEGMTRVLLRPPAILGPGPSSTWNTLRPEAMRDDPRARRGNPAQTFAWVHVSDLASLTAELATGGIPAAADPDAGPLAGGCVAVNVAAPGVPRGEYVDAVAGALGIDPVHETGPAWTGQILADRARGWGWTAAVDFAHARDELVAGLTPPAAGA